MVDAEGDTRLILGRHLEELSDAVGSKQDKIIA